MVCGRCLILIFDLNGLDYGCLHSHLLPPHDDAVRIPAAGQQSPPSNRHSGLFVSESQNPSPIQSGFPDLHGGSGLSFKSET
jgi:hypothetical protein